MSLRHKIEIDLTKAKDRIKIDGVTIGATSLKIEYSAQPDNPGYLVPRVTFTVQPAFIEMSTPLEGAEMNFLFSADSIPNPTAVIKGE